MLEAELKAYNEDGFCVVRKLFSPEEVTRLNHEVINFIESEAARLKGRDINFVEGKVNSIHALAANSDNYFSKLLHSERMKKVVSVFLQDGAVGKGSELFAKPAKVGLPSPWHQDDYYWCVDNHNALTVWIALDRADESNGCVTYFAGSHKIGLLPHVASFAPGSSQAIKDENFFREFASKKVLIPIEPGDVFIHHALTVHGSAPNTSEQPRRGVTLQYIGAKSNFDPQRKAKYEASLKEQMALRESQAKPRNSKI